MDFDAIGWDVHRRVIDPEIDQIVDLAIDPEIDPVLDQLGRRVPTFAPSSGDRRPSRPRARSVR
jgi:hypothetical protein